MKTYSLATARQHFSSVVADVEAPRSDIAAGKYLTAEEMLGEFGSKKP